MYRRVEYGNLPRRYRSIKRLESGVLEVPFISDFPGVRADGTYHFKPNSAEYIEIIKELGELKIGEEVLFICPGDEIEDDDSETEDELIARIRAKFDADRKKNT